MNLPITIQALNPEIPLKKHSATIHIEGALGVVDHKLLNIIYKCAYDFDQCASDYYYLKFSDISKFLGWKRFVMSDIAEALEKLRVAKISWNIFNQDRKNDEEWIAAGATGFIASFLVIDDHGIIRFSLSPEIKRLISNPNIYSYIDLRVQKKLKSKYELILYEVFIDELNRSFQKEKTSRWYSISDIRRLYGLAEDSYTEARDFNKYCIKDPLQAINEHTNLEVSVQEQEKVKRKIVALRFKIGLKAGVDADAQNAQTNLELEPAENLMDKQYFAQDELTQLFNSEKTALQIIEYVKNKYPDYDCEELIKENIECAKRDKTRKQVYSFLGYTRSAIENDYAGYTKKVDEEKQRHDKIIIKQKKEVEENAIVHSLDEEWDRHVSEFNSLSEHERRKYFELAEQKTPFLKTLKDDNQQKMWATIPFFIESKNEPTHAKEA